MQPQAAFKSPCIRQCTLDSEDICVGCHRSIEEICGWSKMTMEQRQDVLSVCSERKALREARRKSENGF